MKSYYDGPDLESVVLNALEAAGLSPSALDSDDLAGMDEFHALGRAGTLAQAKLAEVRAGDRVLDVGAGIAGPARTLARHFGAQVTALDPTPRFCRLARTLVERCGLSDTVTVVEGDGYALPVAGGSFDVVWTQAVWQGIEDKPAMAREIRRALRPGGRLTLLEVVAKGPDIHYPVPWADGPETSFVAGAAELRGILLEASLVPREWLLDEQAQQALIAAASDPRMSTGAPGVGLDLLLPDHEQRMAGLARNVEEGRLGLLLAVLEAA
jgi:SAM-dependent methyltransferase